MKAKQLEYCEQNPWILDLRDLIFTDEMAVVLGHQRGAVQVWHTTGDQYNKTCIQRHCRGCAEWACFS